MSRENTLWFKLHALVKSKEYSILRKGGQVSRCPYFWKGLLYLIGWISSGVIALALTALAVYILICTLVFLSGPYTGWWGFGDMAQSGGVITVVVSLAVLLIGIAHYFNTETFKFWPSYIINPVSKVFQKVGVKPKKVKRKNRNIAVEYYKAYKSKFCPMIKLEED